MMITQVDSLNDNLKVSEDGGLEKFKKVEANFNALQSALRWNIDSQKVTWSQNKRQGYPDWQLWEDPESGGGHKKLTGPADLDGVKDQGEQGKK